MARTLAFLGLWALIAGCPGNKSPDPAAVQKVWEQAKVDTARFEALILNRGAYEADLQKKYPKIWAGLEIDQQVPLGLQPEALTKALEDHAGALGLQVKIERTEVPTDAEALPTTVGPDESIDWSDEVVFREVELALTFTPVDLGQLEIWFRTRDRLGRRLKIRSVKVLGSGARVEATAYAFRDDLPLPVRKQSAFDFPALLKSAGLPLAAVERSKRLREAEEAYRVLNQKLEQIDEALALRTQAELRDARYDSFLKISKRCEAQRWLDVLR